MRTSQIIEGPAGGIEAIFETPEQPVGGIAVLCHPHPQYGGSMHDAVVDVLRQTLIRAGVATLRFNFRGVGASAGSYSGSGGEAEDLAAVLNWVRDQYPEDALLLGGYSFGASMAAEVASRFEVSRLILIAPPVGSMAVQAPDGNVPTDVFVGSADAFVDPAVLD
ncbi:MAG: alpha/beta fold hydrolase, partial [Gammaproteobacteria bacterium]